MYLEMHAFLYKIMNVDGRYGIVDIDVFRL